MMMSIDDVEDLRGDEGHYPYDMRVNDAEYTSCVNAIR